MQPWTVLTTRTVISDRWIHLESQRVRTGHGVVLDPYYLLNESSWACVLPILPDGRLVLIEQYRHGAGRVTLEIPAGDLDDGEDPAVAAARELEEETGYRAQGPLIPLGALYPEPSRNGSRGHCFVARTAAQPQATTLDPAEEIRVVPMDLTALLAAEAEGRFCHAVHVAVIFKAMALRLIGG